MRLIILFLLAFSAAIISCEMGTKTDTAVASQTTTEAGGDSASLAGVMDGLHASFKAKSLEQMNTHFAEDGMFIGTDPNEFWTRQQLNDYLALAFRDTVTYRYNVTKRSIEMSADKTAAVVIDQFVLPFSPRLPVRSIAFAEHVNNKWMIKMFSWNFIANNSDVDKLNNALGTTAKKQPAADTGKVPDAYTDLIR